MTAWHREPMLAFDTETTSAQPDTARIVTATIVEVGREGVQRVAEWLINPGVPISPGATAVHGITNAQAAADGRDPDEAIYEITGRLGMWLGSGRPIVGMNLVFDLTILDRECRRHGIDTLSDRLDVVGPVIDIFVLDKQADRYRKGKRTLSALYEHYFQAPMMDAHTSHGDALNAVRIAHHMAQRFPGFQVAPEALHDMEIGWRADQCAGLQKHLRKTDPAAVVNGDWPVQTLPTGWTPTAVDPAEEADVA